MLTIPEPGALPIPGAFSNNDPKWGPVNKSSPRNHRTLLIPASKFLEAGPLQRDSLGRNHVDRRLSRR